jgi:hypothetical protein
MPFSLYDVSVPRFLQTLRALSGVLDKAEAHEAEAGPVTEGRLAEDMFPFSSQIGLAVTHSAGAVAKLRGQDYPQAAGLETLAGCKAAVAAAIAALEAVGPSDLQGGEERIVTLHAPRGALEFVGQDYLFTFALPNFYFHVTTAYAILRHKGVAIGKRDYLGAMKIKSQPV